MKKSGLHKQIASIFDGGADAGTGAAVLETPVPESVETSTGAEPIPVQESPALRAAAQKLSEQDLSEARKAARLQRPMPVPKQNTKAAKAPGLSLMTHLKKMKTQACANSRQKKMAIAMAALAVVFAAVLFISVGGTSTSQAASGKQPADQAKPAAGDTVAKAAAWKTPQALPETLRDPMKPAALAAAQNNAEASNDTPPAEMIVKGIVFSQSKPTALINNEIVKEGQVINGVTICKIDKNQVEFESNGKRWTQPVQR